MSTASPIPANPTQTSVPRAGRWKNLVTLLLIVPVALFIAIEVPTLISERAVELKRREIGRVGGRCEIKRECPAWLKRIAGEDFHSFLDRSTIVGVNMSGEKIDDQSLSSLVGLTDVRYLTLEDSRVTEKGLEIVAQLKTLRMLNVRNTLLRDFSRLEALQELETLLVDFGKVRDEQFVTLTRIPHLRQLSASRTQMSDAGVAEISKSKSIEELNISYATLGEHGLAPLQGMTNLKVLVLEKSTYNPADLEAFKAAVPGCKVVL